MDGKVLQLILEGNLFPSYLTLNLPNFLNGIIHLTFLALSIIIFRDVQAVLALYWWQRLIIFDIGRIRVNTKLHEVKSIE